MKTKLLIIILSFYTLHITAQTNYTSIKSGDWNDATVWNLGSVPSNTDNIIIDAGHIVTVNINNAKINDVTVNNKGVLNIGTKGLEINGNVKIDGTFTGSKSLELIGGTGVTVDGIGVVKTNFEFKGNATILSTANLIVIYNIQINSGVTVTNFGKITVDNDLTGSDATSVWVNDLNSTFQISDELFPTHGTLYASATGNTVIYNSDINHQNILTPVGNTYYNIEFSGIKEKRALDDLFIDGSVLIKSGDFVSNNHTFYIKGDWISYGIFEEGSSTIIFNGTSDQDIAHPGGQLYYNIEINKTSGTLFVDDDVTVSNTLTMTSGNINVGNKKIILGTSTSNIGTLSYTSGNIIGKFERWVVSSATAYLFPVGTNSDSRKAELTFASLNTAGSIIIDFIESTPGNNGLSLNDAGTTVYNTFIDGYWTIDKNNGFKLGANTFNADLYGTNFIAFAIDGSTRLLTRVDESYAWTLEGTHGTNSDPMVQRNGLLTIPAQYCFADTSNCSVPISSAITGSTDVCSGSTGEIYSVVSHPGETYFWSITGGTQASGGNTNAITVDWGSTGMVGEVKVYEYNGCTYGEPVSLDVNVHTIQPESVSGKVNVPENTLGEGYSVSSITGYTYTWTATGGTIASGQGSSAITVNWGTAGAGNVSVVAQKAGCSVAPATDLDVNIYIVINSVKTGDWNDATTWDCNCIPSTTDNTRVVNPHTVTLDANETANHFTVDAGATLNMAAKTLTLTGDLTVDGTITGSNNITLEGTGDIDGTGTISAGDIFIHGNKTILSSAFLTISSGDVDLNNIYSYMVTNYGHITIANDIIGKSSSTKYWTNQENSALNIGGVLLSTGELIAEAEGNTVNYYGSINQTIKHPFTNGYWNLTVSGSGTKTPQADLDINGDLTFLENAYMDVATGNYNINIAGNWVNTSSEADPFIEGNTTETVTFDANGSQTIISPHTETFNNFSIGFTSNTYLSAGSSVTANGITTLTGIFTLKSPSNDYEPSASFIDNGTINIVSTGKMVAERYINAYQWHEISAPISSSDVTSAVFTRSLGPGTFNPNLYSYNETYDLDENPLTEPAGAFDNNNLVAGWQYAHGGKYGADYNLNENEGYIFYTTSNQMITFSGAPNTGDFDATGLSYTNNDPDDDGDALPSLYDGWHLVGNPYPSSLDWDSIRSTQLTNVDDGIYVWDNTQYAGYQNGISVMSGNLTSTIPPMQGFFVHTNADNASVVIRNEDRVHNTSTQEFLKKSSANTISSTKNKNDNLIRLRSNGNGYDDYMAVYFMPDATKEYDGQYDLLRLYVSDGTVPQLSAITESEKDPLALSCLPDSLLKSYSVQLGFKVNKAGQYTISVADMGSFPETNVYFKDNYTGKIINLKATDNYSFYFDGGDIQDRFELVFNENNSPLYNGGLNNQFTKEDAKFEYTVPKDIFVENDYLDQFSVSVSLDNSQELPKWLNYTNGLFSGIPQNEDVGTLNIKLTATDLSGATTSAFFSIEIENTNDEPYLLNDINNQVTYALNLYTFTIPENTFTDDDLNDQLNVIVSKMPNWLNFDKETGTLYGIPEIEGDYEIEILAEDQDGATASDNFTISVLKTFQVDIKEIETKIYPNPTNGIFYVDLSEEYKDAKMTIYSVDGKIIMSERLNYQENTIDISNLNTGTYLIEVSNKDKTLHSQIIKN